jgi:hypothetical protein
MVSDTVVMNRIDEGKDLVERLRHNSFEVAAAFWLQDSSDEKWRLFIVSPVVDALGTAGANRKLHPIVYADPQLVWISPLEINLIGPSDPVAKAALAVYDRMSGLPGSAIWWRGKQLGDRFIELSYFYPMPA